MLIGQYQAWDAYAQVLSSSICCPGEDSVCKLLSYRCRIRSSSLASQLTHSAILSVKCRSAALANLMIKSHSLPANPVIILLEKKGRRRVENIAEILNRLQTDFPSVSISVLTSDQLEGMSLQEQVQTPPPPAVLMQSSMPKDIPFLLWGELQEVLEVQEVRPHVEYKSPGHFNSLTWGLKRCMIPIRWIALQVEKISSTSILITPCGGKFSSHTLIIHSAMQNKSIIGLAVLRRLQSLYVNISMRKGTMKRWKGNS